VEYPGVNKSVVVLDGCFPDSRVPLVCELYSFCDDKRVLSFATDEAKFLEGKLDLVIVEVKSF
jgi:hypothetical protein